MLGRYNIREPKFYFKQYTNKYYRVYCIKSCRISGFEEKDKNNLLSIKEVDKINSEICSLSRTKRNIKELALCNNFEYFATITVNSINVDRFSLEECQNLLKKNLKKIKRKNSDFGYIFITEKHKNGAFHFHGLVKGIDLYINSNGYYLK